MLILSYPVLVARDKTAFAHPFGLGVKFHSGFGDGTVLVTKSFNNRTPSKADVIQQIAKPGIENSWSEHQNRIAELERNGKPVERQTSFEFYSEVTRKE